MYITICQLYYMHIYHFYNNRVLLLPAFYFKQQSINYIFDIFYLLYLFFCYISLCLNMFELWIKYNIFKK